MLAIGSRGGSSYLGFGGPEVVGQGGIVGQPYGAGGGGAAGTNEPPGAAPGGNGTAGLVVVEAFT